MVRLTLYCATGNPGKLREFRLAGVPVEPLPCMASWPACEETGDTFEANAVLKAEYYGSHAEGLLFADDSGLEVDALGGSPGIYSARYAGV
ncbi:MAG: non-canonical purine NTP pyrophosphatase, partial [Acidobacteriota bacterium]|nr:non-canonical purine NTP pyrophosphatase [Acidobacteriota bacterium]